MQLLLVCEKSRLWPLAGARSRAKTGGEGMERGLWPLPATMARCSLKQACAEQKKHAEELGL